MRIPRKLTIAAAATVTAVLAAGGIAMATPTPGPATGMMDGQVDQMPATTGPQADGMGQMHAGDLDAVAELHAEVWADGDMDAMHGQMGATRSEMGAMNGQVGAMHGDAEQMRAHHDQMVERDPQVQQRHDEMVDRYPEMRGQMGSVGAPAGPRR
jgi:Spy/CpxP family protein refolding chaperone